MAKSAEKDSGKKKDKDNKDKKENKDRKDKKDEKGKKGHKDKKNEKGKKHSVASVEKPALAAKGPKAKKSAKLADQKCIPCRGNVPPLGEKEIKSLLPQLRGWKAVDGHHLEKQMKFPDFASALDFTIEVGELAEVEQHHPDIFLSWGKVGIKIWTHKIDGLTESDFVLAAKIDQLT